jgi:hypothetical protein
MFVGMCVVSFYQITKLVDLSPLAFICSEMLAQALLFLSRSHSNPIKACSS